MLGTIINNNQKNFKISIFDDFFGNFNIFRGRLDLGFQAGRARKIMKITVLSAQMELKNVLQH